MKDKPTLTFAYCCLGAFVFLALLYLYQSSWRLVGTYGGSSEFTYTYRNSLTG
jgi:hypothetical protein